MENSERSRLTVVLPRHIFILVVTHYWVTKAGNQVTANEGYLAGLAKRDSKQRLAWSLKGAPVRSKDLKLTPVGAIAEGRKLRDSITEKLNRSGIDPGEALVSIVFARADLSDVSEQLPTVPILPSASGEIETAVAHATDVPIGFLVFIWDKAAENIFGQSRPLLIDAQSLALNARALRVFDKHIRRVVLGQGVN